MNDVGAGFIRVCTFGRVAWSWLHNDRHGASSDASRPEDNQELCVCAQKGDSRSSRPACGYREPRRRRRDGRHGGGRARGAGRGYTVLLNI